MALLVPIALLVQRALRGVEAERAVRHQAVAERVFDEMERALTELVTREEARPVEAWRASEAARLAELPPEPFVLAYFQVEPDGRVTTPLAPRSDLALRAATGWFASRGDAGARRRAEACGRGRDRRPARRSHSRRTRPRRRSVRSATSRRSRRRPLRRRRTPTTRSSRSTAASRSARRASAS